MQINWFTVIAQVINFLVLVWLLKRFLYKPILKAVDDREKKIAAQIKDANHLKAEAKKEQEDFSKKNAGFEAKKVKLLDDAVADANTQRQKLLDDAKTEAIQLSAKLAAASKDRQQADNVIVAQKIQKQVFGITRMALKEIASESLEEQSANIFIKRLVELDEDGQKKFTDAFASNTNVVLVRSAFELPVKKQHDISKVVDQLLGSKANLQFKTASGLISGIELTSNGYKLAWSFAAYLNELERSIDIMGNDNGDHKGKTIADKKVAAGRKAETEKNTIAADGTS